jgi:hypothetical protein
MALLVALLLVATVTEAMFLLLPSFVGALGDVPHPSASRAGPADFARPAVFSGPWSHFDPPKQAYLGHKKGTRHSPFSVSRFHALWIAVTCRAAEKSLSGAHPMNRAALAHLSLNVRSRDDPPEDSGKSLPVP